VAPAPGDDEARWSRRGLFVLLALTFAAQLVVGAVTHLIGHRQRLLLVDLVFFQAPFVLAGSVLLMPLARRLTRQPRMLRLLEALSLGAIFALFALLLTSVIVHPAVTAASLTADQLIDKLSTGDALGIAVADLLAMVISVQLFPGLQRILTAPGRRARKRLLERRAANAGGRATREARPPR
jgi:cytochrome c oxidase assembly factor CtaG